MSVRVAPAVLVYDSVRLQARFGRRPPPGEDRSLLFRAGDLSLDLLIYGGFALEGMHGQVGDEARGRPMTGVLVSAGGHEAVTDEFGQFSLPHADAESLRIHLRGRDIVFSLPVAAQAVTV